jgi:hypothetical protein
MMQVLDFTPAGAAFVGNEAALAAREGKRGEAAANVALAALPIPGAGKVAKKVAKSPLAVKPQGITAYHGSPHTFDRFDMSKIGTGEGAQTYGHGLYFAENEGVARSYKDSLSGKTSNPLDRRGVDPAYPAAASDILKSGKSPDETVAILSQIYKRATEPQLRAAVEMANPGSMYQVRIDADPADFLDYDAPLSGQSEKVRGAVERAYPMKGWQGDTVSLADIAKQYRDGGLDPARIPEMQMSAQSAYVDIGQQLGSQAEASQKLRGEGVAGIKYLDQGSRGVGEGTRNYVVFDDKLITILKKYGWAPGMAIPAAAMEEYEAEQEFARGGLAAKYGV